MLFDEAPTHPVRRDERFETKVESVASWELDFLRRPDALQRARLAPRGAHPGEGGDARGATCAPGRAPTEGAHLRDFKRMDALLGRT